MGSNPCAQFYTKDKGANRMYYIFAFRSRSESMGFFDAAVRKGLPSKLISTPRAISIGCGLSVKISAADVGLASGLLDYCNYNTFLGLFYYNGTEIVRVKQ